MPALINRIGSRFGRLTVVALHSRGTIRVKPRWRCRCDCGNETIVDWCARTQSCGCVRREWSRRFSATHGRSRTPEYVVWTGIWQRCNNPKNQRWPDYGGRGIKVSERWRSFESFLADMGERPEGMTLDREDNDGDYEKANCRWATPKQQSNNRRKRRSA
jgi:hypothetical protein